MGETVIILWMLMFDGKGSKGRPKNRWEDAVNNDSHQLLGVRNWKCVVECREIWRKKLEEARA